MGSRWSKAVRRAIRATASQVPATVFRTTKTHAVPGRLPAWLLRAFFTAAGLFHQLMEAPPGVPSNPSAAKLLLRLLRPGARQGGALTTRDRLGRDRHGRHPAGKRSSLVRLCSDAARGEKSGGAAGENTGRRR
jgi:hypothetical protein